MTFDELLAKVRGMADRVDISGTNFLAVQITITGDNGGVFYVEVKDGRIDAQPYEYNDRQCELVVNMDNFNKLLDGKLDPVVAFTLGKLKVNGDVGKALEFSNLIK